jgi:hypothetical protein
MNKEYLLHITSTKLKKALLRTENIEPLEDLLNTEIEKLRFLKKLKHEKLLDFGEFWDFEDVVEFFPQVKVKVDSFLGVKHISIPLLEYSIWSGYDRIKRIISLAEKEIANMVPDLGHEYAHHVQYRYGIPMESRTGLFGGTRYGIFEEGHARGVQRFIAAEFMMHENNETYLFDIVDHTVGELRGTYKWMCHKLNRPVRKNLLRIHSIADTYEGLPIPSQHALGNTLFMLYEKRYGTDIYNKAIHGKLIFD